MHTYPGVRRGKPFRRRSEIIKLYSSRNQASLTRHRYTGSSTRWLIMIAIGGMTLVLSHSRITDSLSGQRINGFAGRQLELFSAPKLREGVLSSVFPLLPCRILPRDPQMGRPSGWGCEAPLCSLMMGFCPRSLCLGGRCMSHALCASRYIQRRS